MSGFMDNDPKTKLTRTQNKHCDHPGERIRPISSHQKRAGDDHPIGDDQFAGFKRTAFRNAFELIASDVIHGRIIGASKSKAPHGHAAWVPDPVVTGFTGLRRGAAIDGYDTVRPEREKSLISRPEAGYE